MMERLAVLAKLGLKNVKATTRITHVAREPRDYWAMRMLFPSQRGEENYLFAETHDPKVSIHTIVQ
jgi:hypothetical protein